MYLLHFMCKIYIFYVKSTHKKASNQAALNQFPLSYWLLPFRAGNGNRTRLYRCLKALKCSLFILLIQLLIQPIQNEQELRLPARPWRRPLHAMKKLPGYIIPYQYLMSLPSFKRLSIFVFSADVPE